MLLYDYWFTQFDFPDNDGNPYQTSGGKMVWNDTLKRTVIAEFAAIYGNKNKNIDKSYGSPGGYDGEVIDTMEDLFLLDLFEIYTNCVL